MSAEEHCLSPEEHFSAAVADEEEIRTSMADHRERRHQRLERKNRAAIDDFLGNGQRVHEVGIVPIPVAQK